MGLKEVRRRLKRFSGIIRIWLIEKWTGMFLLHVDIIQTFLWDSKVCRYRLDQWKESDERINSPNQLKQGGW